MKVRGLGDENFFDEFSVSKAAGRHSVCKFTQRLDDEKLSAYQNSVGKTIGVALDGGRKIFFGEVTEVVIDQTFSGNRVEVTAVSSSLKVDEVPATRIFQSPTKTFGDVLNAKRLHVDCSIELDGKLSATPCPEVILQDNETAFEFVNRLAARLGQRVWIRDTWQGKCTLKVSARADDTPEKISNDDIIRLKVGRRGKLRTAELVARKYVELGRVVTVGTVPEKFLIVGLEVFLERGVDRIRYELEEFADAEPARLQTEPPVKLKARVVDVNDAKHFGRLRVQFEIEDVDADKAWIDFRPPHDGIIFLPEVGDTVEVFCADGECFVATTLRTKALDAQFHNVAEKYLVNRTQRIFLRERSLELKSADNSIFMDDKQIVLSVAANKIILDERGITLQTNGALSVDVGKDLSAKFGGKFGVDASGNVALTGSKVEVTASGVAAVKGRKVELG